MCFISNVGSSRSYEVRCSLLAGMGTFNATSGIPKNLNALNDENGNLFNFEKSFRSLFIAIFIKKFSEFISDYF